MARILRYPYEALTETTDYLQIDAKAYQSISEVSAGGLVGRRNPEKVSLSGVVNVPKKNTRPIINEGTVFLPIPSNIQDGNAVSYGDDTLNGIAAAAIDPIKKAIGADFTKPEEASKKVTQSMAALVNIIGDNSAVKDALNRSLAAQAVSIFNGNVTPDQLLARESGEIFNPNMELLFNGVTLRAFKFQFKMTPRDENEADEIRNIIRFFKYNMSPQAGTLSPDKPSYFLRTPNVFQLTYKKGNGEHPFLHKFKLCALESMAVNYTGENVYATYGDGTPVSMIMDLSFKELEPIYASDYDTNQEGVGF